METDSRKTMALGFKKKDLESRDLSKVEIPSYKNLEKIFESSRMASALIWVWI